MNNQKQLLRILDQLSKIRVYNSCGVFQGVMIRDQKKVYSLVMESRKIIARLKESK